MMRSIQATTLTVEIELRWLFIKILFRTSDGFLAIFPYQVGKKHHTGTMQLCLYR